MKSISVCTKMLLNRKYELGKTDCFRIVFDYLECMNSFMPHEFMNVTLNTYDEFFRKDPIRAKQMMIEYFVFNLVEKKVYEASAGDILIAQLGNSDLFSAIDIGNGQMLGCAEKLGVCIISKKYYEIKRVFSCRRRYQ